MSAFLCTDYHFNTLAAYAANQERRIGWSGHTNPQITATLLKKENVRSLHHRYPDDPWWRDTDAEFEAAIIFDSSIQYPDDPATILKACDCYDYQSCETDDYRQSEAAKLIDGIRSYAIHNLPGYDDAPWGLGEGAL